MDVPKIHVSVRSGIVLQKVDIPMQWPDGI